jgi:hypothetical protein
MANPNPSPATRFKPGQSGNPSGRSSAELKNLNEAARIAAELKLKALSSLQEFVQSVKNAEDIVAALTSADVVRLFKEAEDRAHGTPKQSVEHAGENGGAIVFKTVYEERK